MEGQSHPTLQPLFISTSLGVHQHSCILSHKLYFPMFSAVTAHGAGSNQYQEAHLSPRQPPPPLPGTNQSQHCAQHWQGMLGNVFSPSPTQHLPPFSAATTLCAGCDEFQFSRLDDGQHQHHAWWRKTVGNVLGEGKDTGTLMHPNLLQRSICHHFLLLLSMVPTPIGWGGLTYHLGDTPHPTPQKQSQPCSPSAL